jgi:hypothetical protein
MWRAEFTPIQRKIGKTTDLYVYFNFCLPLGSTKHKQVENLAIKSTVNYGGL